MARLLTCGFETNSTAEQQANTPSGTSLLTTTTNPLNGEL